jgi:hypothetical protein
MTLRDNLTKEQAWAHAVLDDVRDGFAQSPKAIRAALRILREM